MPHIRWLSFVVNFIFHRIFRQSSLFYSLSCIMIITMVHWKLRIKLVSNNFKPMIKLPHITVSKDLAEILVILERLSISWRDRPTPAETKHTKKYLHLARLSNALIPLTILLITSTVPYLIRSLFVSFLQKIHGQLIDRK